MSASLVGSEMCIRDSPSRASGTDVQAVSGPAQFQVRTPEAIWAFSMRYSVRSVRFATRFDRYS
eukprot:1924999-Alexandrium_andersonii.AAC.1